jgi:hypothetical protein
VAVVAIGKPASANAVDRASPKGPGRIELGVCAEHQRPPNILEIASSAARRVLKGVVAIGMSMVTRSIGVDARLCAPPAALGRRERSLGNEIGTNPRVRQKPGRERWRSSERRQRTAIRYHSRWPAPRRSARSSSMRRRWLRLWSYLSYPGVLSTGP